MKKNPNLLWITAIALGWLFDFLFWKERPGINFAIFIVLCLIGGFFILRKDEKHAARGTLWLIPLILFFAAITFIRAEPLTVFLSVVLTLFLMGVTAITFLGGRWIWYSLADYFFGFLKLIGSMIARPLSFSAEVKREEIENKAAAKKINLWPVLRGIVIALPVVAIFAALLSSADVVFGNQLDAFIKLFKLDNLSEYIFRLVYILIGAYLLAGVFLHAASESKDEKLLGEGKPSLISRFLGFTESAIVLGSVTVLFAAFVAIQFRYFFGGQSNINIEGYTYSEYARRGFGELIMVAFFSLFMILGLGAVTRRENEAQRRAFSGLSVAILALVLVMLVSAYQRLVLYETAYGFSRLRAYTHVVLIWIGLLLGAVVVLEILRRERSFATAALFASIGFVLSLSLLNVDGFIVRQNVNRATQGKGLDVPYLVSLSTDSVAVLADEFQSAALPGLTRDAVGAVLFCRTQSNSGGPAKDWRGFTLSQWRAEAAINKAQEKLSRYRIVNENFPIQILTPGSVLYNCLGGSGD
ncbi:MAG: DUF4173 domain-containing protein [Chloroflexi bacterium]|nr:DUF4173 domain-containing protein [Chloroflexota bacterium]